MTVPLTPDLDRDALVTALGRTVDRQAVRTGEARRRRLQKNLRRLSRAWETTVEIDEELPTTALESTGPGDDPEYVVTITGRRVPQPVTEYDPRAWDWLVQRALAVHEAGHIRYTDYADWASRLDAVDSRDEGVAHTLHNALEDAAIETQIADRWSNYREPLRALRANLLENATVGIPDPEQGGFVYPLVHAVHASILDGWLEAVYGLEFGVLDSLLDPTDPAHHFTPGSADRALFETEVVPHLPGVVETVRETPAAAVRNETIFAFVRRVLDVLDEADVDGRSQQKGRADAGETGGGMPDDSRDNDSGENLAEADALGGSGDEEADSLAEAPRDVPSTAPGAVETIPDLQARAVGEAADDARAEAGVTDAELDELETLQDGIAGSGTRAGDGLRSADIMLPTEDWNADQAVLEGIEADYRRLARLFRNRLQHERRTAITRGTRRGRLDPQRLYRTGVEPMPGDLKRNRETPEEKAYHMAFVLDRSASMGRKIREAELALGLLIYALEEVGVETEVFELYDSAVRLAKPFGIPAQSREDRLFHGRTGGGTPLSTVLRVVRTRLNHESVRGTRRAMFVVTDGKPADPRAFSETIAATTFPVLGVTLAGRQTTGTYTRSVAAKPGAELTEKLRQLATEVML
ncbi:MAG: hypothetical protein U5K70_05615 [Halodesulfurarchaeum sp.]|nr:hypothetical protein [Halodesulfurarchaeum sp.]